jgi:hypothetical protein
MISSVLAQVLAIHSGGFSCDDLAALLSRFRPYEIDPVRGITRAPRTPFDAKRVNGPLD